MSTTPDTTPPAPLTAPTSTYSVWSIDHRAGARWLCWGRFTSEDAARKFCITAMDRAPRCHWSIRREKPCPLHARK